MMMIIINLLLLNYSFHRNRLLLSLSYSISNIYIKTVCLSAHLFVLGVTFIFSLFHLTSSIRFSDKSKLNFKHPFSAFVCCLCVFLYHHLHHHYHYYYNYYYFYYFIIIIICLLVVLVGWFPLNLEDFFAFSFGFFFSSLLFVNYVMFLSLNFT